MKTWSVYKHTSPNGKVYIGITSKVPSARWGGHGQNYSNNKHFWGAIKKYGWDAFKHEILYVGLTEAEACAKEVELIAAYDSTDPKKGYNISKGGIAQIFTEATKERISAALKERYKDPEARKKMSIASMKKWESEEFRAKMSGDNHWNKGKHRTDETKKKISATRKERHIPSPSTGKHLSEETKRKISKALTGKKPNIVWTEERRNKYRAAKLGKNNPNYGKPNLKQISMLAKLNSKPVRMIREDGSTAEFSSAKEASRIMNITASNITRTCRSQRGTAGGFRWVYV